MPVGKALVSPKGEDDTGRCGEESDDGKYEHSNDNTDHDCCTSVRANRVQNDLHERVPKLSRRTIEYGINVDCNVEHSQERAETENPVQK